MNRLIAAAIFCLGLATESLAQTPVMGTSYYLPRTALHFRILVETTHYEPGQFARYAERYMRKLNVGQQANTTYRIIKTDMTTSAVPDTAKHYTLNLDKKISISKIDMDGNGILLAINAEGRKVPATSKFVASPKVPALNPKDFMNEDILAAGSTAKMAELCATEIYDIRESRNLLQRGQADNMPKDGEQLKLMFAGLDTQEKALLQVFEGTTTCDTTETIITMIPSKEVNRQLLFRFSKKLGFTDIDDLGGAPFYIAIEDEHITPKETSAKDEQKKSKEDFGLNVNIPGKIKIHLLEQEKQIASFEAVAGQFGGTENLSSELFGKKQTSHIILNPISGGIESIESEVLK